MNFEDFKDDENKDLNTFFGEEGAAPPAPPKPQFDTSNFHHATAGGFGSAPVTPAQPVVGLQQTIDLSGGAVPSGPMGGAAAPNGLFPGQQGGFPAGKMGAGDMANLASNIMQNGTATSAFMAAGASSLFAAAPQMGQDAINTLRFQLTNMKPWPQFFWPYVKPQDSAEAIANMTANISFFQTNYAICFVAYLIFQIVYSPVSLCTIGGLTLLWLWFLRKNEDPEWVVTVSGIPLGPTQRYVVLILTSALLVFMLCGTLILSSCLFFSFFSAAHASIKVPVQDQGYAPPPIGAQGNMV